MQYIGAPEHDLTAQPTAKLAREEAVPSVGAVRVVVQRPLEDVNAVRAERTL